MCVWSIFVCNELFSRSFADFPIEFCSFFPLILSFTCILGTLVFYLWYTLQLFSPGFSFVFTVLCNGFLSLSDQIYKSFITYGLWDIVSHNASVYTQVLEEFIHVFLQYVFRFMFIRYLIHFNIFSFLWVKNGSSLSFSICPTTIFLKVYFRPSNLNVCAQSLSCIWLFATLWTVAHPAPLSMGIFRQEYQNWLPFLPPGEFEYYHYQKNFIYSTALGVNCIMQDLLSRCAGSLVVALGLSGPSACGILVPGPGIKPVFPALQGRFFTTGPPREIPDYYLYHPLDFCVQLGIFRDFVFLEVPMVPSEFSLNIYVSEAVMFQSL